MELLSEMVVFAKVVELRSFSQAARQLGLTSSAVSRCVGRLEAHMGGKLLHRTTRAVTPSELGLEVYAGCSLIARTARDVKSIAGRYASAPIGRLTVSAPVVFGQHWLGPRLPGFLDRWPEVQLHVTLTDRLVDLVDEGFDIALRITTTLPPGLVARPLLQTSYVLVASPAYLQRRGEPRAPAELAQHDCVLLGYGAFTGDLHFAKGREEANVQVQGRLAVNNSAAILGAAEAGVGIGLLPDFTAAPAMQSGSVQRVLTDWSLRGAYIDRKVYAIYSPTRHLPHKVRAFIDHLAESTP
jgi:DNA-binding transcriptional LysR family regulator